MNGVTSWMPVIITTAIIPISIFILIFILKKLEDKKKKRLIDKIQSELDTKKVLEENKRRVDKKW